MSARVTDEQLETWSAACEARTPGAWRAVDSGMEDPVSCEPLFAVETDAGDTITEDLVDGDADFIAIAAEAVPALLSEVMRLRMALAQEREACAAVVDRAARAMNEQAARCRTPVGALSLAAAGELEHAAKQIRARGDR